MINLSQRSRSVNTRGTTIVEFMVYMVVLVVSVTVVVGVIIGLGKAYSKTKAIRAVNQVGVHVMDRIAREVRQAKSVSVSVSVLPGETIIYLNNVPATYAEAVRKDGAASHWNFEEAAGKLIDQIGSNDASQSTTIVESTQNQDNRFDNAQRGVAAVVGHGYNFIKQFDSNITELFRAPDGAFDNHSTGTIETILKPGLLGPLPWGPIFGIAKLEKNSTSRISVGLYWSGDDKPFVYIIERVNNYDYKQCRKTTDALSNDSFYHLAIKKSGSSYEFYINGALAQSEFFHCGYSGGGTWFADVAAIDGPGMYTIADARLQENAQFGGVLDELAIYPVELSAATIKEHYRTAFPQYDGGGSLVNKQITITSDGKIKMGTIGGTGAVSLSSDAVIISGVTATTLGTNGNAGLRLVLTATSGSGSSLSSAQFQTIISLRNP